MMSAQDAAASTLSAEDAAAAFRCARLLMSRSTKLWIVASVLASCLLASDTDPVQWTLSSDAATAAPGAVVPLRLTAKLDPGWHLYSLSPTPDNIPVPTTVSFTESASIESLAAYQPKPKKKLDPSFGY